MGLKDSLQRKLFIHRVRRALRSAGARDIRFDEKEFLFRFTAAQEETMFLHNLFDEYLKRPIAEQSFIIQAHIRALTEKPETPASFDQAGPLLLPRIRERAYFELVTMHLSRIRGADEPLAPLFKPAGSTHAACLELDFPSSTQLVTRENLTQWGVSFEDAFAIALANLRRNTEWNFSSPKTGVFVSTWRDVYDASRILLPEFPERVSTAGDPVVLIPNRNTLLITGSEDAEGLEIIAQIARKKAEDEARFMSYYALVLRGGRWMDFLPREGTSEYAVYRQMHAQSLAKDYNEQKDLLDEQFERNGIVGFVASYNVYRSPEGEIFSLAVWSKGVISYLPAADRIALFDPDTSQSTVYPFARVQEAAAHLMEPQGWAPERWLVREFPDNETIKRLGTG